MNSSQNWSALARVLRPRFSQSILNQIVALRYYTKTVIFPKTPDLLSKDEVEIQRDLIRALRVLAKFPHGGKIRQIDTKENQNNENETTTKEISLSISESFRERRNNTLRLNRRREFSNHSGVKSGTLREKLEPSLTTKNELDKENENDNKNEKVHGDATKHKKKPVMEFSQVCSDVANLLCDKLTMLYLYFHHRGNKALIFSFSSLFMSYFKYIQPLEQNVPTNVNFTTLAEEITKMAFPQDVNNAIHALLNDFRSSYIRKLLPPPPMSQTADKDIPNNDCAITEISQIKVGDLLVSKPGYREEFGSSGMNNFERPFLFEECASMTKPYTDNFLQRPHTNFVCVSNEEQGPCAVSVTTQQLSDTEKEKDKSTLFSFDVFTRFDSGESFLKFEERFKKEPNNAELGKLLKKVIPQLSSIDLRAVPSARVQDVSSRLVHLETLSHLTQFKFGLLYQSKDQLCVEDEIYRATSPGSVEYEEFLEFLGTKIELENWPRYRGGLDVSSACGTGKHSLFTLFKGCEIMFHVATMLPSSGSEHQIEKKRHIGNDIVVIVFQDGDIPFDPSCIRSNFNHIFFVVRADQYAKKMDPNHYTHYKVAISQKETVRPFPPRFPENFSFPRNEYFREFILTKLVNAEISALKSSYFAKKMEMTRRAALSGLM